MTGGIDDTLAALADPTRRAVIDLLRRRPRRAGELAEELSLLPPAMSRHLRVLRQHGIVEEDHDAADANDARIRVYRLRPERFAELRSWLEDVERFWTGQLDAFKQHAERTRGAAARKAPPARPAKRERGREP